jgi:hypothetical protein
MSTEAPLKLLPRNVAAFRRGAGPARALRTVPGNPVSTRLESGVGNCFPGLECDLRNLERRFFPFLEVDVLASFADVRIVAVDVAGVNAAEAAGSLDAPTAASYRAVARSMPAAPTTTAAAWTIRTLEGTFGPLGQRTLTLPLDPNAPSMGPARNPPDAWTAIRMLTEDTAVRIVLGRIGDAPVTLRGRRVRYLDDNGALADIFLPGELAQSLCSPWTHDFRDCACFYWASNHPDIVLPPDPPTNTTDPRWNLRVDWERRDRTPGQPPAAATQDGPDGEMEHLEINRDWQRLNFVLEGREQTAPYKEKPAVAATPFSQAQLEPQLRYAAGVELAVMHVYLAAAFSLRDPQTLPVSPLRDDIEAAHYEITRIAVGEMRHIRAVRNVLAALPGKSPPYDPPLRIATAVPSLIPTDPPFVLLPAPLMPNVLDVFVQIEAPNVAVDGLYSRILATVDLSGDAQSEEAIRRIMTEGQDHQEAFMAIREWLRPHQPDQYLRSTTLAPAPVGHPARVALQNQYRAILDRLHAGYSQTTLAGATDVNAARDAMLTFLAPACEAVAQAGFLVTFDAIADPRFAAIPPPP